MGLQTGERVGLAFGLNIAAGLATVLGGCVIYSKKLVYLANPMSLAVALGVSSGVMVFISLVEIWGESHHLIETGMKTSSGNAWLLATVFFALGIAIIYLVDFIVHKISPEHEHDQLQNIQDLRESFAEPGEIVKPVSPTVEVGRVANSPAHFVEAQTPTQNDGFNNTNKESLNRMGILAAIAIGLHNIPEGIATYVGAVQDTRLGLALAIGIALHNIPEGIAVAAPVFFATKSRFKAILWCFLSALAEPFGGLIAWIAIGDGMSETSEGILFGIVCGMMVGIVVKELIPTAFEYANGNNKPVVLSIFAGMFIMVFSLILFEYAGV